DSRHNNVIKLRPVMLFHVCFGNIFNHRLKFQIADLYLLVEARNEYAVYFNFVKIIQQAHGVIRKKQIDICGIKKFVSSFNTGRIEAEISKAEIETGFKVT